VTPGTYVSEPCATPETVNVVLAIFFAFRLADDTLQVPVETVTHEP